MNDSCSYDYDSYLETPHWQRVRSEQLKYDNYQCSQCGTGKNLDVHHITYENLGNEAIGHDVVTLCRRCHEKVHSFEDSADRYAAMASAFSRTLSRDAKNIATAAFFWYAWPKFTANGGSVNLLNMTALSALRADWCKRTGVNENDVKALEIQGFCNRYMKLLVLEKLSEGMTVKEIADQLGVSESSVSKRRKDLKMKIGNWTTVDAAGLGGEVLGPGGYVVRIQRIQDHAADGYLDVTIDIAEGDHANMYAGSPESDDWRHTWRRYYEGGAAPFFKQFLEAIEISNRGRFSIAEWERTCDEQALVGLELGVIFQKRLYTKQRGANKGKDGWSLNWFASIPAQDIRNGDYTVPADEDKRDKAAATSTSADSVYDDIDF